MKKALIITSLVALLGTSVAMADYGFGGGKGMDRLTTFLGLSDTQAAQVDSIMQEQQARMQALRDVIWLPKTGHLKMRELEPQSPRG